MRWPCFYILTYFVFLDAYTRALSTSLFTRGGKDDPEIDVEQIVPLVLARAGVEKRLLESESPDQEKTYSTLMKVMEDGLVMVRQGENACYGITIDKQW